MVKVILKFGNLLMSIGINEVNICQARECPPDRGSGFLHFVIETAPCTEIISQICHHLLCNRAGLERFADPK